METFWDILTGLRNAIALAVSTAQEYHMTAWDLAILAILVVVGGRILYDASSWGVYGITQLGMIFFLGNDEHYQWNLRRQQKRAAAKRHALRQQLHQPANLLAMVSLMIAGRTVTVYRICRRMIKSPLAFGWGLTLLTLLPLLGVWHLSGWTVCYGYRIAESL